MYATQGLVVEKAALVTTVVSVPEPVMKPEGGDVGPEEAAALQKYVRMVALHVPTREIRQQMG